MLSRDPLVFRFGVPGLDVRRSGTEVVVTGDGRFRWNGRTFRRVRRG